jgi:hypothetical protein
MAEIIKSRKFFTDNDIKNVKITGVAKLNHVTHDGLCGYRCIAEQDGIPVDDVVQRFISLSSDEGFVTAEVINIDLIILI